jgi:hypothetical protein
MIKIAACFVLFLAFVMGLAGWHIGNAGYLLIAVLGLALWCLSELLGGRWARE